MEVHPDQIVIGSVPSRFMVCSCSCSVGDLVYGVEDPGYPRLTRIYESNDVAVRPIASMGKGRS